MTPEKLPQRESEGKIAVTEIETTFDPTTNFITEEYKEFSEAQRARWDLFGFIRVKVDQFKRKRKK